MFTLLCMSRVLPVSEQQQKQPYIYAEQQLFGLCHFYYIRRYSNGENFTAEFHTLFAHKKFQSRFFDN